jgi:hypothetical protein
MQNRWSEPYCTSLWARRWLLAWVWGAAFAVPAFFLSSFVFGYFLFPQSTEGTEGLAQLLGFPLRLFQDVVVTTFASAALGAVMALTGVLPGTRRPGLNRRS